MLLPTPIGAAGGQGGERSGRDRPEQPRSRAPLPEPAYSSPWPHRGDVVDRGHLRHKSGGETESRAPLRHPSLWQRG